ncbi:YCF48-related protein [Mesorhizobium sp. M0848]|uniref:WD40/YVTN/BNR-like repeat-containing protein n=1 Tax=Mesorhizobium sp. M0848 TaxID=2957012 RepID=UPI00333D8CA7
MTIATSWNADAAHSPSRLDLPFERRTLLDDPVDSWLQTAAPIESAWTPDICFASQRHGWAINASGQIVATVDGGLNWFEQALLPTAYLSCVGFAGTVVGWVGTLTPEQRLFCTRDGGATWRSVNNLPPEPQRITCLSVVDESTVVLAGGAYPTDKAAIVWTRDGGESWATVDLTRRASVISDVRFLDASHGWVVGGRLVPGCAQGSLEPVVLETRDSCTSWHDAVDLSLPAKGAARKLSVSADGRIAVSLGGRHDGILVSDDGGRTWRLLPVKGQTNLDGVCFVDRNVGWVGGWGDSTFTGGHCLSTTDGGMNWARADHAGLRISRFATHPNGIVFAAGDTIYSLNDPASTLSSKRLAARRAARASRDTETSAAFAARLHLPDRSRVTVRAWAVRGRLVWKVDPMEAPFGNPASLHWDMNDGDGRPVSPGPYLIRIVVDNVAQSRIVFKAG